MSVVAAELWAISRQAPQIDASALARAVEAATAGGGGLDYRTRLLIRDSLSALRKHWGSARYDAWLRSSPQRSRIEDACRPEHLDRDPNEVGFPSLEGQIVDATAPQTIERFLRELSLHVTRPTRLVIGGSIALILSGHLIRHTEDLDVVDEIPAELRDQHPLLQDLLNLYKLRLAHFQSHYLPDGWSQRLRSFGTFARLQVFLVDPYDIFLGKLFSARKKDREDLNAMASRLDRETLVRRLRETTASFRADATLLDAATKNWYVLFGEPLPS